MKNIDFSIIILNTDTEELYNNLKSIEKQNYNKENIEVIIATEQLSKEDKNKLKDHNLDIKIKEYEEFDTNKMYNESLDETKGKYIQFSNSKIKYLQNNILTKVRKKLENYNYVVTKMIFNNKLTNSRKKYIMSCGANKEYNLNEIPGAINFSIESYFINKDTLRNIKFDNKYELEATTKFIVDLYNKTKKYYNYGSLELETTEPYEDNKSNKIQYYKEWYDNSLKIWESYIRKEKKIEPFLQETILYVLTSKFKNNMNSEFKHESDELFNQAKKLLSKVDTDRILENDANRNFKIDRNIRQFFYKQKEEKRDFSEYLSNEKINILAINYEEGKLVFDAHVDLMDYIPEEEIKINIQYLDEDIKITRTYVYSLTKAFNRTINEKYSFKFAIDPTQKGNLTASYVYKDVIFPLKFNFIRLQSRLDNTNKAYWAERNYILKNKIDKIKIVKNNPLKIPFLEIRYLFNKFKNGKNKTRIVKLSFLRILYYLTKPFYKNKHIWITYDKLYKGGDNGEYIYQYGLENNKNIYYLIKKDSKDFERLISNPKNKILVFNSLKAKLYCLHSEAVLKTHAGIMGYCGFDGIARPFVRGILNPHVIEVQHGLTIQDIPEYQNRLADNIRLYTIASKFEYKNIIQDIYGYKNEQIKYTGIGRYDGLKNNDKRQILITPTWRHNIAAPSLKHGTQRAYNDTFKESDYFKIFNTIINNEKLIDHAKKYNYRVTYLVHPTLASQIEDFDKNDYVDIVVAGGDLSYEKILRESSVMVTDYSGVQYDFAYMRKSLVYFHPKELPPHYNNGSIDYEKDGFGPITTTIDELVSKLCQLMKKDCKNEKKYIERANIFFEFDDYDSSKRIVEEVEKYLDNIEK